MQDTIEEYAQLPPLIDPIKKPTPPRLRLRPPTTHHTPKQERAKPVPVIATATQSETASSTQPRDSSRISNGAVFRGLHVATAAACDEDIAKWIEEITGTGIRKFLADLSAFDGLGVSTLAGVGRRAAKQRRDEVMAWERAREKRMLEREVGDWWEDCEDETTTRGGCKDRKMGFVAGDEVVNLREKESGEEIREDMFATREGSSREGLGERALRMGWRDRNGCGGD